MHKLCFVAFNTLNKYIFSYFTAFSRFQVEHSTSVNKRYSALGKTLSITYTNM